MLTCIRASSCCCLAASEVLSAAVNVGTAEAGRKACSRRSSLAEPSCRLRRWQLCCASLAAGVSISGSRAAAACSRSQGAVACRRSCALLAGSSLSEVPPSAPAKACSCKVNCHGAIVDTNLLHWAVSGIQRCSLVCVNRLEPHQQGVGCHAQQQERSGRSERRALIQLLLDVRAQGFQLKEAGERFRCITQPYGRHMQFSQLRQGKWPSAATCMGTPACRRAQAHAMRFFRRQCPTAIVNHKGAPHRKKIAASPPGTQACAAIATSVTRLLRSMPIKASGSRGACDRQACCCHLSRWWPSCKNSLCSGTASWGQPINEDTTHEPS